MSTDNRYLRLQKWQEKDSLTVYESAMLLCGRDPYEFSGIVEAIDGLKGNDKESLIVAYRHLAESSDIVQRCWQLMIDPRDEFDLSVEKSKVTTQGLKIFAKEYEYHLYGLKEIKHHDDLTYYEIISQLAEILCIILQSGQSIPGYENHKILKPDGSISARGLMSLMSKMFGSVKSNTDRVISEAQEVR